MDTQSALTVLGNLLGMQGRYDEITPFFEEVLETRRRILGNEQPQTLMAINSMGHLLHRQGTLDQAVVLYKESLDGFRRNLGNAHHDTMLSATSAADPLMPAVGITTVRGPPFSEHATDGAAVLGTLTVSLPE